MVEWSGSNFPVVAPVIAGGPVSKVARAWGVSLADVLSVLATSRPLRRVFSADISKA